MRIVANVKVGSGDQYGGPQLHMIDIPGASAGAIGSWRWGNGPQTKPFAGSKGERKSFLGGGRWGGKGSILKAV